VFPSNTGDAHPGAPDSHGDRAPSGPAATATHAPCAPLASHASHSPVHAVAQQKPSTQKPLVHAVAFEHVMPSGCFFAHTPLLQKPSVAQSVSSVHRVVHVPPVQRNGSQLVPVALLVQVPSPSQICPVTTVPLHWLVPHETPAGVFATPAHVVAFTPSHAGAEHTFEPAGHKGRVPCGCPLTGRHVPGAPVVSHAWHCPPHAELQQ
jgi:hypothetical protein